jgi:hypothetical protein
MPPRALTAALLAAATAAVASAACCASCPSGYSSGGATAGGALAPSTMLLGASVAALMAAPASADVTTDGCECLGECKRTLDGFLVAWCYTSVVDPPPGNYCGKFSASRNAYWAECVVNVTSTNSGHYLTTFNEMVQVMAVSTTALCGILFGVAGCIASVLTSPRKTALWLPVVSAALGAFQGFFVGAPFAVFVAFLYLSIPYAIDFAVALNLGVAVALLVVYMGLGRHHRPFDAPHPAELE